MCLPHRGCTSVWFYLFWHKPIRVFFVSSESADSADLYITYSGSHEYVGVYKFGKNPVGPVSNDKGIHREKDWCFLKTGTVNLLTGSSTVTILCLLCVLRAVLRGFDAHHTGQSLCLLQREKQKHRAGQWNVAPLCDPCLHGRTDFYNIIIMSIKSLSLPEHHKGVVVFYTVLFLGRHRWSKEQHAVQVDVPDECQALLWRP